MTYIRRNKNIFVVEKRQDLLPSDSLDIVMLELKIGQRKEKIYVLNIYNAPTESVREGQIVKDSLKCAEFLCKQSILAGDLIFIVQIRINILHTHPY